MHPRGRRQRIAAGSPSPKPVQVLKSAQWHDLPGMIQGRPDRPAFANTREHRPAIGLVLPQEEGPGEPEPSWGNISGAARLAEDVGFDAAWLVDHFLWARDPWERNPGDYGLPSSDERLGALEAWTTIAGLAAVTSRIQLGTVVTCTRYRNPALLAKMADTVDGISNGRLILGLGAGDNRPEHEMFGYTADRPVSHFAEALQIIVPLLRTGAVDFEGEFYRAHAELLPRGPRAGGPPILLGSLANRPRMLSMVAKYADIWNSWVWAATEATAVRPAVEAVEDACRAIGRDPDSLRRSTVLVVAMDGPMARNPDFITGSIDDIAHTIAAFADEGVDEVQVRLFPNDLATIEQFGRVVEQLTVDEGPGT